MAEASTIPCIYVLAGTNGAGKSSVLGEMTRAEGADYFNPDEVARDILEENPGISQSDANSLAWHEGKRLLEEAIANKKELIFETTLGAHTIPGLLEKALREGMEVRIWYVGLSSPELHIERVRKRVAKGGHDIPEKQIRDRYENSRVNLIHLLPHLTELRLFDNSEEGDPHAGIAPKPKLILHIANGLVVSSCNKEERPEWTKSILEASDDLQRRKSKE